MDPHTKQVKQTCNQTKKKLLTLEARHSISIEASNKIRSKLSPRLFIPRIPICRPKTKNQSSSKEFKSRKDFKSFKECESEDFIRHFKGKYTKKPQCNKSCKTMDNKLFRSKSQSIKVLRKTKKRSMDSKLQQKPAKLKDIKNVKTAKDDALRASWRNIQIIENESTTDSTRHLPEGEIIFMDRPSSINSPKPLHEDNFTAFQNSPINITDIFKRSNDKNSLDLVNKNSDNCPNMHKNRQEKNAVLNSSSNLLTCPRKDTCNKLTNLEDSNTKSKQPSLQSTANATNSNESFNKNPNCNILNSKITENEKRTSTSKPHNNLGDFFKQLTIEITIESLDDIKIPNQIKATGNAKKVEMPVLHVKKPSECNNKNNKNLINNKIYNTTKLPQANKPHSIECLKNKISPARNPLEGCLNTVADFQNSVKSSISFINDCSPIEENINRDLMKVKNSVERFSKFLLHSYNDLEHNELKTNNCVEYLRRRVMDQRTQLQQNSSQASPNRTNCTEETTETLTIFIDADEMPTKSITFKTSDILNAKLKESHETNTTEKVPLKTNSHNTTNLKRKNSNGAAFRPNTNQHNIEPNKVNTHAMEMCKNKRSYLPLRTKTTAQKHSTLAKNPKVFNSIPIHTSPGVEVSNSAYESNCLKNTILCTNPCNLIYTQAQNNLTSYLESNLAAVTKCPGSLTSQVLTESPATVRHFYNHCFATEKDNSPRWPLHLSENYRPHIYPLRRDLNGEPSQMRNENQTNQTYFQHQSFIPRVPYLQNPYSDSMSHNFQAENNFCTANVPAIENVHLQNYQVGYF